MRENDDFVSIARELRVEPIVPLLTREKFAELVGLPVGVITGFCNRGYLPCMSIGRYSLINVALLQNRCLAKEFE